MSTPKNNDGGPAFPSGKSERPGFENSLPYYEGMTLRDWFAGMALQGQLSLKEVQQAIAADTLTALVLAGSSYEYADAMLAARERKEDV